MTAEEEVPSPSNPMAVARHVSADWQAEGGQFVVRKWRGSWMRWSGACWKERDEQEVRADLYKRLEHATFVAGTDKNNDPDVQPWAPNKAKIANLLDALTSITLLSAETDAPSWIEEPPTGAEESPVVACSNGLLRIRDRELLPLDPGFFNLVSVPFSYDPEAEAPAWERFLKQVWPDDPENIRALQEWFGYVLSGRTDQQKILLIVGPTRSGKGTIARVLAELVGRGNIAGPTLASLGSNFGLSSLVDKPLAVISDARLSGKDGGQVVERLLTISGEDTIDVDRKYRELWTGKMPTRLMILSNELPNFGDASGVIAQRFVALSMSVSWLGKEDTELTGKLAAEMPGILNWALDGLARLEKRGYLAVPASSREVVTMMQDTASPTSAFVRECCETGPTHEVSVDELWALWREWAEDNGVRAVGTKQLFGRNLQSVVPQLRRTRPRDESGRRVPAYSGIGLNSSAHIPPGRGPSRPTSADSGLGRDGPRPTEMCTQPEERHRPGIAGPNVGPCAGCGAPTVRYGPYGRTHCPNCR